MASWISFIAIYLPEMMAYGAPLADSFVSQQAAPEYDKFKYYKEYYSTKYPAGYYIVDAPSTAYFRDLIGAASNEII